MPEYPIESLQSQPAREAIRVIDRLRDAGFVAYLAGGCVRDGLLGRIPKDFDVATDATPDSVRKVFGHRQTLAFGASFGVIGVLPEKTKSQHVEKRDAALPVVPTEVATFRADGTYSDGRRPDHVTYGDAEADAARRDFTINGMFFDPLESRVIDFVGGQEDLVAQTLSTIGKPEQRFEEDKLRMLRAVRFATTLEFVIEPSTHDAIAAHAEAIELVSGERIGAEMRRLLQAEAAPAGMELLVETRLANHVWPGLEGTNWRLLKERFERCENQTFEAAVAICLATVHEGEDGPASKVADIVRNWRLSTAEKRSIKFALEHCRRLIEQPSMRWSELQPILIDRDVSTLVDVVTALDETGEATKRLHSELRRDEPQLNPAPLLSGNDLLAAGYRPGPHFARWLQEIRRGQLDGELSTQEEALEQLIEWFPLEGNER